MAFEALVSVVKQNFPALYQYFPSVRWQPITAVLAVHHKGRRQLASSHVTIYICKGSEATNRFIARPVSKVATFITRDPSWRFEVEVDGERFLRYERDTAAGTYGQRSLNINHLFFSGDQYLDAHGLHSSWSGARIPSILRTVVYDWLREELPEVFAELCKKYAIEMEVKAWTSFFRRG